MGQWISGRDVSAAARMRLFCLPHAGSGSAVFYRWKRLLPDWLDVCPIFLPGREIRLAERAFERADELLDALVPAVEDYVDRPFAIFGHSMGALLAFELAHRLRARGAGEPQWLFCSGRIAPQSPSPHRGLSALPEPELLVELGARYGGLPKTLLDDPEMLELFLPILRADLAVVESHRYREEPKLACAITVYAGRSDHSVSAEGLAGWQNQTSGPFASMRFEGDHFYHLGSGGADMVEELSRSLIVRSTT